FHLCLYAAHVWPRHRPYVSVALSRGFRRVAVSHRPALWCPDFPRRVVSPSASAWLAPPMLERDRPPATRDGRPGSNLAEDSDYLAEDPCLGRDDRVHFLVLGLETDVVGFAEVALDGRLFADQGDDDFAVGGVVGGTDDDVVGFEDAGVLHRFAADLKD